MNTKEFMPPIHTGNETPAPILENPLLRHSLKWGYCSV
jgi:hypothetical protein